LAGTLQAATNTGSGLIGNKLMHVLWLKFLSYYHCFSKIHAVTLLKCGKIKVKLQYVHDTPVELVHYNFFYQGIVNN